ncbi:hypothetical protein JTB14_025482 [Gonioctena quinquepunctata]|nr:hypothetical protein JTB14_025482 [Gonioctena quinquepunctata]
MDWNGTRGQAKLNPLIGGRSNMELSAINTPLRPMILQQFMNVSTLLSIFPADISKPENNFSELAFHADHTAQVTTNKHTSLNGKCILWP